MTTEIKGYRNLDQTEVNCINYLKSKEKEVMDLLEAIASTAPEADKRALAIATTDIQTGFMWAVRAVARPE